MKKSKIYIIILLAINFIPCFSQDYILPHPDYNEKEPSPPSIVGRIKSISASRLIVEIKSDKQKEWQAVTVKFTKRTEMFTVYGGLVFPKELVVGQKVRVWFTEKNPTKKPPIAAVIMLASIDPNDDWP
ncbi:MAG: hypothetical protein ABSD46_06320 [Bacteroidota bacterium]